MFMTSKKSNRKRLFLIDGYALLYRSHFALIRNPLINSKGMHTSALFGFINQVLKLIRKENPDYLMAAFDTPKKTFRHEMYPEYKATREKMPEEMREQLPYLWKLLEAMKIPTLEQPGFEADDIIGTLAVRANISNLDTFIVSGDKDFMQLVNDNIFLYSPSGKQSGIKIYDKVAVEDKWGVPPEKIRDLLGLMGDSSDNVPGVMGVGEKTAVKLLKEYGTLENALDHADDVKNKRAREGLQSGREKALLSQELVTIDVNMNIDSNFEDMTTDGFDVNKLDKLFHELEFQALINQIKSFKSEVPIQNKDSDKDYKSLLDLVDIQKFSNLIKEGEWLSFDLETTSLDPMSCDIVGFSFSNKKNKGVYIPIIFKEKENSLFDDHLNSVLNILRPLFENSKIPKTGQNIKFDALILRNHGIKVSGIKFDTLLAAHLISPDSRNLKLENLSFEHLNYRMIPIDDLIGKGRNQISMGEVELEKITFYASEDADIALQLTHIFEKKLKKQNLDKFFNEIEIPLLPVLLELEYNGMFVDAKMLSLMSKNLGTKIEDLTLSIQKEAGTEFNINSTQQLANILFDIIGLPEIKKRSTAEEVLNRLKNEHALPSLILEYRKLNKLKNTYIDALPALINLKTKRIHSTFSQTVTSTGRLSSRNPNFQNIPIRTELGREIRKAFRSENKGWKIFSADYSQIELRIMAHLSQDNALLDAFRKGEDIHTRTAADVFNVSIDEVIPEMRRTAKIVNFGLLYGAGPFRMSQELGIPQKEAKSIIEAYFERYSGIKNYIDSVIEYARNNKYVETMLGRRRQVWDIDSTNHLHKEAAKRMAINMPIQGTNAEMIKIAMIDIQKELISKNMISKMLIQIHDELVFEVPSEELDNLQKIVVNKMENSLTLSVPIIVDCGNGDSWYEAH
jgi:DNA polymerase-1